MSSVPVVLFIVKLPAKDPVFLQRPDTLAYGLQIQASVSECLLHSQFNSIQIWKCSGIIQWLLQLFHSLWGFCSDCTPLVLLNYIFCLEMSHQHQFASVFILVNGSNVCKTMSIYIFLILCAWMEKNTFMNMWGYVLYCDALSDKYNDAMFSLFILLLTVLVPFSHIGLNSL